SDPAGLDRLIHSGADDLFTQPLHPADIDTRLTIAEARIDGLVARPIDTPTEAADRAEVERQFRIQQAFLEGLFEAAPEGVVIVNAEGRVVRSNREFSRMFGYPPEEAEGSHINDLIVPPERRAEGAELDGGVLQGDRVRVETVRRHKDGHSIHVSVLATDIDVDGPVGAFAIYRDITDKKRQEAALRESEERYRALFDQSPVGV